MALRVLRRLSRALHNSSLSRVPSIRTVFLYSETRNALLSSARWGHSGHGRASLASLPIPNNQKKKPLIEVTQLSDEDYCSLVAVYFEAVMEYSEMAQEEGSSITLERQVRSHLIPYGFNSLRSKLIVLFPLRMTL